MSQVWVEFEFTAPAKVNSHNLDRILDAVREWAADRFGADRISGSVIEPGQDRQFLVPPLAARMNSADLATHVEALNEFRDALQVYHDWRLHGMRDYSQPKEPGLRLVPLGSDSGEP